MKLELRISRFYPYLRYIVGKYGGRWLDYVLRL